MIHIQSFTFNDFQENTYVLSDESGECIIIDPGCYSRNEKEALSSYIKLNNLKPMQLLNTHCHIDHILGNHYISDTYNLLPSINKSELIIMKTASILGQNWGIQMDESPEPGKFLDEGDTVVFGNSELEVLFLPGHSPGSIGFLSKKDNILISGDVLFHESIGRTDLPGGDLQVLLSSIKEKLFILNDSLQVYSGHGPSTTIGHEKENNPFLVASFFNQN